MKLRKALLVLTVATSITMGSMTSANAGLALAASGVGPIAMIICAGGALMPAFGFPWLTTMGVLLLDKETNNLKFNEVKVEDAQKLNLTEEERVAFNDEIDRVNAASEELTAIYNKMSDLERSSSETSKNFREALSIEISSNAFNAYTKIILNSLK